MHAKSVQDQNPGGSKAVGECISSRSCDNCGILHAVQGTSFVLMLGLSKAEIQAAVLESEKRLAEKHARLEGAVVQVLPTSAFQELNSKAHQRRRIGQMQSL